MSPIFTRTLFAGASVALTLAMVSASAPAVAANVAPSAFRQTTVQFSDLNLASPAGQKTLALRLNAAAEQVCPDDSVLVDMHCRAVAIDHARTDIARMTAPAATGAAN